MLSKSLKNLQLLKKDKYFKKDSILNEIYYKNNYLIKLNELKFNFYTSLFDEIFDLDNDSKIILDKLVYLYKKYKFFVFNDFKSAFFILSACGSLEDFSAFYQIFKQKYNDDYETLKKYTLFL